MRRCVGGAVCDPRVSDTLTPSTAEVLLHPDFVMPVPEHSDAREAVAWWCDRIRDQARAAYPGETDQHGNTTVDRWLERACYPGPIPTEPLDTGEARSFWPPLLTERLAELRVAALQQARSNTRFFNTP